jgi:hypothetical protein
MAIRKMLLASVAVACATLPISAHADTSGKKIALSNNYAGNSWRQAMLTSWDKVTKDAVKAGTIAAADPFWRGLGGYPRFAWGLSITVGQCPEMSPFSDVMGSLRVVTIVGP